MRYKKNKYITKKHCGVMIIFITILTSISNDDIWHSQINWVCKLILNMVLSITSKINLKNIEIKLEWENYSIVRPVEDIYQLFRIFWMLSKTTLPRVPSIFQFKLRSKTQVCSYSFYPDCIGWKLLLVVSLQYEWIKEIVCQRYWTYLIKWSWEGHWYWIKGLPKKFD